MDVKSRVHVFLDGITFVGLSKEERWSCLSKPLPYNIQVNPKRYTFTTKNISPEICVHYGPQVLLESVLARHGVRLQAAPPRPQKPAQVRHQEPARLDAAELARSGG